MGKILQHAEHVMNKEFKMKINKMMPPSEMLNNSL
jgi:hypothetical protein